MAVACFDTHSIFECATERPRKTANVKEFPVTATASVRRTKDLVQMQSGLNLACVMSRLTAGRWRDGYGFVQFVQKVLILKLLQFCSPWFLTTFKGKVSKEKFDI